MRARTFVVVVFIAWAGVDLYFYSSVWNMNEKIETVRKACNE